MKLRSFVGGFCGNRCAVPGIRYEMALRRPVDAIGPVQAVIEPLRRVWRRDLMGQHEPHLVDIGGSIVGAVEVAAFPAPIAPSTGKTVEHLAAIGFAAIALAAVEFVEGGLVRNMSAQESGDALLGDRLQRRRHPGAATVFLRQNVDRRLAPVLRHRQLDLLVFLPVDVTPRAHGLAEFQAVLGAGFGSGEMLFHGQECSRRDNATGGVVRAKRPVVAVTLLDTDGGIGDPCVPAIGVID